ncbi:MAG TPA: hypothetical protein PLF40_24020 [Kofleriaceae bacterium]|nr:hypothetical protein [Kofleriaceae bacterium]
MATSLAQRLREQTDAELLAMCIEHPADYAEDALQLATEILAERGIDVATMRRQRADEQLALRQAKEASLQRIAADHRALLAEARARLVDDRCLACGARVATQEQQLAIKAAAVVLQPTLDLSVRICRACLPAFFARRRRFRPWSAVTYVMGAGAMLATTFIWRVTRSVGWAAVGLVSASVALPGYLIERRDRQFRQRIFDAHPAAGRLRSAGFEPVGIGRHDVHGIAAHVRMLSHGDANIESRAVMFLQALGTSEVVQAVLQAFTNPAATANCAAVLMALRPMEAVPQLREAAANSKERVVRDAARDLLVHLGETPPQALPTARVVK